MKHKKKQWLRRVSWEQILAINEHLCQTHKTEHETKHEVRAETGEAARQLWEKSASQEMSLPEAFEVCRRCCDLSPFVFYNANTFSTVAKSLIESWLNLLPSVEAQIARTTIGHYVADHIVRRKELNRVLRYFESRYEINGDERPLPAESPQFQADIQPRRLPVESPQFQRDAQPRVSQA